MSRNRGWRSGWLGKILGIHSPSAHAWGSCWCRGTKREIFPQQYTAEKALADMQAYSDFMSKVIGRGTDGKHD